MKLNESMENYLETILLLNKDGHVRSIDIARHLKFSKASVSVAMRNLIDKEFIIIDGNGYITLTKLGLWIAKTTLEKHDNLIEMLVSLGVDEKQASIEACGIEHQISDKTLALLKEHFKKHKELLEFYNKHR